MSENTSAVRTSETAPAPTSRWLVLTVMCVGYFLVLLDETVINAALPQIGAGPDSSVSGLQWVVDGYALALAALLLTGGTIGDLRGHKPVVLTGLAVFGVASLGCGLAPSTGMLIAARAVQGIGAALLLPGTLAIISRSFHERGEQARAIGIWPPLAARRCPRGHCSAGCWCRNWAGGGCSSIGRDEHAEVQFRQRGRADRPTAVRRSRPRRWYRVSPSTPSLPRAALETTSRLAYRPVSRPRQRPVGATGSGNDRLTSE